MKLNINYSTTLLSREDKSNIEAKVIEFTSELTDYSDIDCKYFQNESEHYWDVIIRSGHNYYHARSHDSSPTISIDKALKQIRDKIAS